jgi:hypothetical protein
MTTIVKYYAAESIEEWADRTLDSSELVAFNTAFTLNHNLWAGYEEQNLISFTPIYQDVYIAELNETVSIRVGERTILAPGVTLADLPLDETWRPWLDRYISEVNAPEVTIE